MTQRTCPSTKRDNIIPIGTRLAPLTRWKFFKFMINQTPGSGRRDCERESVPRSEREVGGQNSSSHRCYPMHQCSTVSVDLPWCAFHICVHQGPRGQRLCCWLVACEIIQIVTVPDSASLVSEASPVLRAGLSCFVALTSVSSSQRVWSHPVSLRHCATLVQFLDFIRVIGKGTALFIDRTLSGMFSWVVSCGQRCSN